MTETITPRELYGRMQRGERLHLLDVRTPAEHAGIHIPGVRLVPLDRLDPSTLADAEGFTKDEPIFVVCQSGRRATQAAEKLETGGFSKCHVLEGGTAAWAEAGLPVNRGTGNVISLERQVRIAAGAMVLLGVLLGYFVHGAFIWLAAFVGAGLMFAGITDWCGMGLLLARLPWNQRSGAINCAK